MAKYYDFDVQLISDFIIASSIADTLVCNNMQYEVQSSFTPEEWGWIENT
jgi:hypothetical protein